MMIAGVSTFADSKFELDYVEVAEIPLVYEKQVEHSEPLQKLIQRQRQDSRTKTLWLGYPARLRA